MARNNILLRLTGDGTEAKDVIRDVEAEGDRFGKKSWEAAIHVDAAQAKADMASVIAEAKAIPRDETIRIRVAGEQAKLQALQQRMEGLQKALSDTAASGGSTDRIITQMGAVGRQIDATRSRVEQLGHDFDDLGSRGFRAVKKLDSGIAGLLGHVPLIGGLLSGVFNGVSNGLNSLVQKLPQAAQGFAGVLAAGLSLAALAPVIILVVGAVAALVVSLAQALIGIVALGVAFLAALAPIAVILAAVVLKLKDAYTAQQNLVQATNAQKQAVIALHQAQQNESNQRLAALEAEKEAVLALHDAEDQVAAARLNVQQTAIGVQQAKLALAQFKSQMAGFGMSPGDLNKASQNVSVGGALGQTQAGASSLAWQQQLVEYRNLVLGVAEAEQQHTAAIHQSADAEDGLVKAQQTSNQFAEKGLKGYAPYADAISQAATATLSLHTANHNLQQDAAKMKASDGVLGVFDKLKATLGKLFGPAVGAAFRGLGQALGILGKGLVPLVGPMTKLGEAIGKGFVQLARMLTSKTAIREISQLIDGAAKLVPVLISFFGGLGGVLIGVANAAMPHLIGGLKSLGDKFIDVAKHPKQIAEFIDKCIHETKDWFQWIGRFVGILEHIGNLFTGMIGIIKMLGGTFIGKLFTPITWALNNVAKLWGIMQEIHAAQNQGKNLATANFGVEGKQLSADVKSRNAGAIEALLASQLATFSGGGLSSSEASAMLAEVKAESAALAALGIKSGIDNSVLQALLKAGVLNGGGSVTLSSLGIRQQREGTTIHQTTNIHGSHDPHHEAAVITRRMRALGGGVR
jgi:hypothetical protein